MITVYIAPKPLAEYGADEFHSYVQSMYSLRDQVKPKSSVPGITITKTKKGTIGIRRTSKDRAFEYVTFPEIAALSKQHGILQSDLWNAFKAKEYIVTKTRMEAEKIYADINQLPWG